MPDLRMTPTRIAVLRAVADPAMTIYRVRRYGSDDFMTIWLQAGTERVVTRVANDLAGADLIEAGDLLGPEWADKRPWRLTEGAEVHAALDV
ncbi:hypothetical protein [Plantactinospora endophytica]|uniref:Uncharacterized protein n=1 Tax=Plantactinospora endophytica TaxID=673535 RepID=A0ABQ4EEN3_9ACTN|nr:hypothetical protein [Plantactinospora endophytica]GIG93183.1 hypothetical protein Pen02_81190 [Plantactinospora endophytica]